MNRLSDKFEQLTAVDRKTVEDLTDFLLTRHVGPATGSREPKHLQISGVRGMLSGLAPDKTDVDLQHEALHARAADSI